MAPSAELQVHKIQKYGWIPDLPDARDHMYSAPRATMTRLPSQVDLRPQCPPVYDQGELGSWTPPKTSLFGGVGA